MKNFKNLFILFIIIAFSVNAYSINREKAQWKKNTNSSSFSLYIDNVDVTDRSNSIMSTTKGVYVYYSYNKTIYLLNDFKTKIPDVFYDAQTVMKSSEYGFWYKFNEIDGEESYKLFNAQGNLFDFTTTSKFYFDDTGHYIGVSSNSSKVVLENAKNNAVNKIKPIVAFNAQTHNKTTKLADNISASKTPSVASYTWKKEPNNSYRVYKNKKQISGLERFWNGNDLVVIDNETNTLVSLKGFNAGKANVSYIGFALDVDITNGFWIRRGNNNFRVYNGKGEMISDNSKKNTWSSDKNDIIITPIKGSSRFVLKNFMNAEFYKVYGLQLKN